MVIHMSGYVSGKPITRFIGLKDGGVLGSLLAILVISILNIDIYTFAIYMLMINIVQNMFDYYKWLKFLR